MGSLTPARESFNLEKKIIIMGWGRKRTGRRWKGGDFFFFLNVNNGFLVPSFKYMEGSPGEPNEGAGGEEETFVFFLVFQE